ncbi:hypothetical protein J5N97_024866 [Dioscorea zingiberensis]|uniref:Aminotransferase-like plant mobile domain-containing protein n=1 Tax=Dioscorea zingiberensis TaxID=325984 RepID=A0A9D5C882_9LILI|nr:hypothetical protein J5N97_024866 [Dioscorea zingiberensis]
MITSWGFGGLLHVATYSLRMKVVEDLVACFNPDTGILSVHGRALHMTHSHAGFLLGLPSSGVDVNGIIRHVVAHKDFGIARTLMALIALYDELIQMPNGEDFKRKLFYIVGTVIRPTGNVHISTSYLSLLGLMDGIKNMNWAMFAFEGMLAAVRIYKNGRAQGISNKCIGGCIWLLQLFYLEHLVIWIIHQPIIGRKPPRVTFRMDNHITCVVKHVNQHGYVYSGGSAAHTETHDINELKSKVVALQREVDFLRSHQSISNADVRRDMGDLIYGAVEGVREDLASQGKEIDAIRRILHDFMVCADDGTKTSVGTPDGRREEEANNASQDHVKVTASPVVISSTDVAPVASPIPEIGVTQDIDVFVHVAWQCAGEESFYARSTIVRSGKTMIMRYKDFLSSRLPLRESSNLRV